MGKEHAKRCCRGFATPNSHPHSRATLKRSGRVLLATTMYAERVQPSCANEKKKRDVRGFNIASRETSHRQEPHRYQLVQRSLLEGCTSPNRPHQPYTLPGDPVGDDE